MIRFRKEILLAILACTLSVMTGSAQDRHIRKAVFAKEIYFQFDKATVNEQFSTNARTFQELDRFIGENGVENIDSVVIIVQSSPEGVYEHNISLTRRRAAAISRYMNIHYPAIASKTTTYARGEAWDRFRENVLNDSTLTKNQLDKILKVLDADINIGTRKWRMERLDTYPYLLKKHYPRLRLSAIALVYASDAIAVPTDSSLIYMDAEADLASSIGSYLKNGEEKKASEGVSELPIIPLPVIALDEEPGFNVVESTPRQDAMLIGDEFVTFDELQLEEDSLAIPVIPPYRYPVVAFKTNFLMPGFNAGIEVPIGKHWSVAADWYWPWFWPKDKNEKCYELLGGAVEGRYWFGKDRKNTDRLLGHSIGLYVHSGYYDLEKGYRGMQGEFVSTGLDYKYALGLGGKKHKKWGHLEFSIGLGYLYSTGRTYDVPKPGGALIPDHNVRIVNFFGPTRAEVSLVIPIYKRKEGGK